MKAHIETACFLNSGRTTLIQASNKDAAWIKDLKDITSVPLKLGRIKN